MIPPADQKAGRISIALIIHSLDRSAHPTGISIARAIGFTMGVLSGFTIALPVQSLDRYSLV